MNAEELNGTHIDQVVTFGWSFPHSEVDAFITGLLREVQHDASGNVILWVTGQLGLSSDKNEFMLDRNDEVGIA